MKGFMLRVCLMLTFLMLPCVAQGMSIADAKASPEGTSVNISGSVTAVFNDRFYVESTERNCAIQVYKLNHGVSVPTQVTVYGTVTTSTDGERYIAGTLILKSSGTAPAPLFMNWDNVGGSNFRYKNEPPSPKEGQEGTTSAAGLNNIGLLVRVAGTLQSSGGTRATLFNSAKQITVITSTGTFSTLQSPYPPVVVTGISSCEKDSATGLLKPVIRLANSLSLGQRNIQWLAWPNKGNPAQIEPDVTLPVGTGTANISNTGGGCHLRVLLYNEGGTTNPITDILINGISLNSAFAARQPSGKSYYLYSPRFLSGGVPTALMNAGEPVWYRIRPIQCGSKTCTELMVRLRTQPTSTVTVAAKRSDASLIQLSVNPPSALKPRFGFVTTSKTCNVIHAYVLLPGSNSGEMIDRVRLDGTDVTDISSAPNGYGNSGVLPVDITPAAPLVKGSYHLLECLLVSGEHVWATFRAGSGFATAMFGNCNVDALTMFYDLHDHYIDAWRGYTHDPANTPTIAANGVRMSPNEEGDTISGALSFGQYNHAQGYDLYSYWLYDEPDLADGHNEWSISPGEGLNAQYLEKMSEALAQGDPTHPSFVNMDGGGYYTYGQVCDITSSDYYYPNNAPRDGWNPLPLIYDRAKSHRAGAMPCPALRFLNASSDPTESVTRAPFPGEERVMYYASIGAGDNGLYYYWYNCSPDYGCQYQTELWAEIAKINKETKLLESYVGSSFPAVFGMTLPANTWMRVLATGKDTLMCSLINTNYSSTLSAFTYTQASSVPIIVTLPAGRTPVSVVYVDSTGPHALSFTVSNGRISFNAGPLDVGKIILISFKTGLLEELTARWQALAL